MAGYSSSKWALEGLSRSAAYVYSDWGIRSSVIQPGWSLRRGRQDDIAWRAVSVMNAHGAR